MYISTFSLFWGSLQVQAALGSVDRLLVQTVLLMDLMSRCPWLFENSNKHWTKLKVGETETIKPLFVEVHESTAWSFTI